MRHTTTGHVARAVRSIRRGHRRLALVTGAAVATAIAASGCGRVDITQARLQNDLGPTFSHLYILQQDLLGQPRINPPAQASVVACTKGSASVPDKGAGDWTCRVNWPAPDGTVRTISYDVRVQPQGCYTAQGPPSIVGQQTLTAANGRTLPNPLYEFDGCFDTT